MDPDETLSSTFLLMTWQRSYRKKIGIISEYLTFLWISLNGNSLVK